MTKCSSCGHDCSKYNPGHSPTCDDCPCAVNDRIEEAYRLLAQAEQCEDAKSLFDLCVAAREILKPRKKVTK